MSKLLLKESELQEIVEKKVFQRVCESVVRQDGDKWKIKGKGDKDWDTSYKSKADAEKALKEYLDKK